MTNVQVLGVILASLLGWLGTILNKQGRFTKWFRSGVYSTWSVELVCSLLLAINKNIKIKPKINNEIC
jgi:hypothetical protein